MKTVELGPGAVCVELSGEFDLTQAYEFDREVRSIEEQAGSALVIDLREVSFVDSAGLARILAARRRAQRAGRRFAVVRGSRAVQRLFALTAVDHQLEMINDPRAVLAED
ncbi:MAG: anti-sigma factor antagonist [Solirubrobacteraceae bacterium]|jgi:anti-anti-sigma factor|nr:anti-sigma factor antagonist [Solirubrobacteraceae bacterium]